MPKKRKKRGFDFSDLFEDRMLLDDSFNSASGSGYSISITYGNNGKPLVKVQTQGNVDKTALRDKLKKKYPDAKVEGLDDEPLIKEISTKKSKHEKKKEKEKPEEPLIKEID